MRREARKKQIEETIIKQAIALFKQKGYDNVTVEEITLQSGIAKGTFFNYFPKKEHVLLHVATSHIKLMGEIAARHAEGAVKDRVLHIFRDLLAIYFQHAELLRLTLVETLRSAIESKEETSNIAIFQDTLRTIIEEAKQKGEFRCRWDSDMVASILVGLFFNALIAGSARMDEQAIYDSLCAQLQAIWEGIANEPAEKNS
ncbi:TetR/AcrR family transcriptional regulator [Paenibacillus sp. GCM10027626]|uniref:TetR/AcrR family transcriptional regulator n=1 Tax=Paenibacillus sp. GCM10027626 TaxID=3273411 RepID=UPI00362A893B